MKQDKIFFGEQGLSSTSADFIANLAKEMLRKDESRIGNINFVCEQISAFTNPVKSDVSIGMGEDEVRNIPAIMERIMRLKSLIAWLREAIKAKERLLKEVEDMEIGGKGWDELGLGEEPKMPHSTCNEMTKDDYMAKLSIADRNKMYSLQTKAAVLGKILHKDGALETARERLYSIMTKPREVESKGLNNIIHYYEPSVDSAVVDEVYFKLSAEYREAQASLNAYLHDMEAAIKQSKIDNVRSYLHEEEEWNRKMSLLHTKLTAWKAEESRRIGKLKIVIPNSLRPIYEEVQKVGK